VGRARARARAHDTPARHASAKARPLSLRDRDATPGIHTKTTRRGERKLTDGDFWWPPQSRQPAFYLPFAQHFGKVSLPAHLDDARARPCALLQPARAAAGRALGSARGNGISGGARVPRHCASRELIPSITTV